VVCPGESVGKNLCHANGERRSAAGSTEKRILADLIGVWFILSTVTGKPSAVTLATVSADRL